jgi:hypothetical protein
LVLPHEHSHATFYGRMLVLWLLYSMCAVWLHGIGNR